MMKGQAESIRRSVARVNAAYTSYDKGRTGAECVVESDLATLCHQHHGGALGRTIQSEET
eukprot:6245809-Amphidinium_carterae.1